MRSTARSSVTLRCACRRSPGIGWRLAFCGLCADCCGAAQTKGTPALVDSLLGDFIEKTPGVTADGRTTRDALGPTTTNDPRGRHLAGPGPVNRAMPAACNTKLALAWRYPTRAPCCCKDQSPSRLAERQRPAPSVKRVSGVRRHPGRTAAHPSDWRYWVQAVPSRAAMTHSCLGRCASGCRDPPRRCNRGYVAGQRHAPGCGDCPTSSNWDATEASRGRKQPTPAAPPSPTATGCAPAMLKRRKTRTEGRTVVA